MAATGAETCEGGYMQIIARKVGTDEAALRFLISMFAGYPLAIFLRDNLHGTSATTKHLFISAVGLAISYFNYGMDTKYLLFCSLVNYIVLCLAGGTGASVIFSFVFNVGYLLVSYAIYASNDYDMNWTTPQCILTLRMISVAYDLYDGHTPVEKLSPEQKSLCFKEPPGPLEMVSYSFFFGYLLTGPQVSVEIFMHDSTISLPLYPTCLSHPALFPSSLFPSSLLPSSLLRALFHVVLPICISLYLPLPSITAIYLSCSCFVSNSLSPCFIVLMNFIHSFYYLQQSSFLYKLFYISLFGRFTINKYVTFWLISEGVCILSGIAYTGKDKAGKAKFTSCSGIKPLAFETALSVRDMVATFNISTNTWLARYVYKRLKFLGNRYVSQIVSLMFLAAWHGLHIGYYNNFILEFFIVMFDVQATELFTKVPILNKLSQHRLLALVKLVVLKFLMLLFMGYPLVSFVLLRWSKMHAVYKEVYYIGHIFFLLLWPILSFGVIMPRFKAHRRKSKENAREKSSFVIPCTCRNPSQVNTMRGYRTYHIQDQTVVQTIGLFFLLGGGVKLFFFICFLNFILSMIFIVDYTVIHKLLYLTISVKSHGLEKKTFGLHLFTCSFSFFPPFPGIHARRCKNKMMIDPQGSSRCTSNFHFDPFQPRPE
eukprot:XP_011661982.1 PREDICTED: lysophospholipid acyltransferase 5 [Strongylocentrotus purpuratus]